MRITKLNQKNELVIDGIKFIVTALSFNERVEWEAIVAKSGILDISDLDKKTQSEFSAWLQRVDRHKSEMSDLIARHILSVDVDRDIYNPDVNTMNEFLGGIDHASYWNIATLIYKNSKLSDVEIKN
jgi:hypothetical protein